MKNTFCTSNKSFFFEICIASLTEKIFADKSALVCVNVYFFVVFSCLLCKYFLRKSFGML